ncbi:MAG: histidinol dehydrogenase [Candidatus Ranarchaeia archaeon]
MEFPILRIEDLQNSNLRNNISKSVYSEEVISSVKRIVSQVKEEKDDAILKLSKKFDNVSLTKNDLKISKLEIDTAYKNTGESIIKALRKAAKFIERYHKYQLDQEEWWITQEDGTELGQIIRPIETIGVYIPGGLVPYPSTVLMNVIPAQVAGVKEIVLCSPPTFNNTVHPTILATCKILGITEIYKIGGAQAIAAMAFGTETIPSVQKIVGPGNKFVNAAKLILNSKNIIEIDMIAGPSECLILADETANSKWIAIDLLSQLEHDVNSIAILVTTSEKIIEEITNEVKIQLSSIDKKRKDRVNLAIENGGRIIHVPSIKEGIKIVNDFAPEHLEINTKDPMKILELIRNVGAIGIGEYSPVALTDYGIGINHVLPTSGYAKYRSGLSTRDFVKLISVTKGNKNSNSKFGPTVMELAKSEDLMLHYKSMRVRLENDEER